MSFLIFGQKIQIKKSGCNQSDIPGHEIPPSVNLFVKVTKSCNAKCLFCSNANTKSNGNFNQLKLFTVVQEIIAQGIIVNRINITGGEPSLVPDLVQSILDECSKDVYQNIHLHLNTNGLFPQSQDLMKHPRWDSISMSLHHYNINKLSELYGVSVPETAFAFEGIDMAKVNVSCNLIKGYIDCAEEAHKILDFTLDLGMPRIGFVALMKVNDYCLNHYVDFEDIGLNTIPHVYFTKSMDRGNDCKCSNYLYNKKLKILEIYTRNYMNPLYCESSLVYDGDYLRQGFHENNIIY
ncbi:MAG: radical SAM protein [Bacteroidales bacterium]|jgi:pyruvate-formate lyase-activating enzyme|nr:radical SAM protein [Bacteroidales bacterium]